MLKTLILGPLILLAMFAPPILILAQPTGARGETLQGVLQERVSAAPPPVRAYERWDGTHLHQDHKASVNSLQWERQQHVMRLETLLTEQYWVFHDVSRGNGIRCEHWAPTVTTIIRIMHQLVGVGEMRYLASIREMWVGVLAADLQLLDELPVDSSAAQRASHIKLVEEDTEALVTVLETLIHHHETSDSDRTRYRQEISILNS
jgi:hypothetical protein